MARAVVGLAYVVAVVASDELTPDQRPYHLQQGIFAWDGTFYRDITADGYGGVEQEGLRFFPFVPLLARLLSVPLLGNTELALALVSNVGALVAAVLLYRLAMRETGDVGVAGRSLWLLALLPPAMVLVLGYAESTMMTLSIAAFLAYRSSRWWAAAAAGYLAGLTRPVAAVLALPAAIEAARGWRGLGAGERVARGAAVVAPVAGLASFLAWVHVEFGDWMLPVNLQNSAELREGYANPVVRAAESFSGLFGDERFGDGLHAPWILLYVALTVVVLRRLPLSYGVYTAVMLTAALSAADIGSFERYGLSAFPLVLAMAMLLGSWKGVLERPVLTASAAGLAGFSVLAFLGAFVP